MWYNWSQQFRLDLQRGANLTEQSLLELDCESFTYNLVLLLWRVGNWKTPLLEEENDTAKLTKAGRQVFVQYGGTFKNQTFLHWDTLYIYNWCDPPSNSNLAYPHCNTFCTESLLTFAFHWRGIIPQHLYFAYRLTDSQREIPFI